MREGEMQELVGVVEVGELTSLLFEIQVTKHHRAKNHQCGSCYSN